MNYLQINAMCSGRAISISLPSLPWTEPGSFERVLHHPAPQKPTTNLLLNNPRPAEGIDHMPSYSPHRWPKRLRFDECLDDLTKGIAPFWTEFFFSAHLRFHNALQKAAAPLAFSLAPMQVHFYCSRQDQFKLTATGRGHVLQKAITCISDNCHNLNFTGLEKISFN